MMSFGGWDVHRPIASCKSRLIIWKLATTNTHQGRSGWLCQLRPCRAGEPYEMLAVVSIAVIA
jgi:hypothetical protein